VLTRAERELLLGAARAAIEARLAHRRPFGGPVTEGSLARPCGAFVSLHRRRDRELRGCIGRVVVREPLLETVAEVAVAAATQDPRFEPVRPAELGELRIEISVLEPPRPIRAEQVEVGRHGLIVRHGGLQGLLLPQVPVEHRWDRERFLAMTCRKAGLPEDAWRRGDCELLGFEAEVFGEPVG
jgi:AmmeMemoRadiSam system protein A